MPLLADSKFEREALVSHAKFTPVAASVNLPRGKLSSLQFDGAQIPGRQTPSLQIPWAAIGAVFAVADAGASILASLVGAEGYPLFISGAPWNLDFDIGAGITAAVLYLLIGRSSGFYRPADIFSLRRNASLTLWQWLLTSLWLTLLAFLFRIGIQFSRGSIICFAGLALAALFASLIRTMGIGRLRRTRASSRLWTEPWTLRVTAACVATCGLGNSRCLRIGKRRAG
jgi:hypothetical protein